MAYIAIIVGSTPVAAFSYGSHGLKKARDRLATFAPGCKARIKVSRYVTENNAAARIAVSSKLSRRVTNRLGGISSYPRPLKPGEFKL